MQVSSHANSAARSWPLMLATLAGTALVVNAFIAQWLYAANPLASEISAFLGALILAIPIFWTAIRDLWKGYVYMNELVAIAVLAAMASGDYKTAGVISFFMLIALLIETRSAAGAHQAIEQLIRMTPKTARRLNAVGEEEEVSVDTLQVGDRLRVRPGDQVPTDGVIRKGGTTLNEATITGESLPRDKTVGHDVFAGTQNLTGAIEIEITRIGNDTTLGHVRELILAAEQSKLPIMRIIDRYARYYTPVALMLAALVWFFTDDWNRVIALLIIACPCAFILATPTAMVAALSAAARLGVLVKNVQDLEAAGHIDMIVLDKTGTLTTGELGVTQLAPRPGIQSSDLLRWAASAERHSNHPAALALQRLASETGVAVQEPTEFREEAGQGVSTVVDGHTVLSGRATWLQTTGIDDKHLTHDYTERARGVSAIFIAVDGVYQGWIGLADQVRPESAESLEALTKLGIGRLAMVTGDRQSVAESVAHTIHCPEFKAECLPHEKVAFVEAAHQEGYRVVFVGDGVNDAPALAAGDMGIAMGAAGSDVAIHSATVALMNNDLRRIPFLIELSRAARLVIHQNIAIGGLFIMGGLVLTGLGLLAPIAAAIIHNAGSMIVVFNSARLIRQGEDLEEQPAG